ncbi:hypothetical protein U9M48_038824 [Paspalum notatum var. saurae]|uniref:Uncharacterized protein n=1 Tax=Paspalum notatum var. saurae TaxID=547442 RepID=A0AAQ3UNZ3_PASNO
MEIKYRSTSYIALMVDAYFTSGQRLLLPIRHGTTFGSDEARGDGESRREQSTASGGRICPAQGSYPNGRRRHSYEAGGGRWLSLGSKAASTTN